MTAAHNYNNQVRPVPSLKEKVAGIGRRQEKIQRLRTDLDRLEQKNGRDLADLWDLLKQSPGGLAGRFGGRQAVFFIAERILRKTLLAFSVARTAQVKLGDILALSPFRRKARGMLARLFAALIVMLTTGPKGC